MKKTAGEMILILVLSLSLGLLYNMISPSGLRILPKKESTSNGSLLPTGTVPAPKHLDTVRGSK